MKSITNKKIKTFSLGFNEIEYDESNYAKNREIFGYRSYRI